MNEIQLFYFNEHSRKKYDTFFDIAAIKSYGKTSLGLKKCMVNNSYI